MLSSGEECQRLFDEIKDWPQVGAIYGITSEAARNRGRRWRKKHGLLKPKNVTPITSYSSNQQKQIIAKCNQEWNTHVQYLKSQKRNARYVFWTDIHAPYQDDYAIELAAKVTEDVNPDVVNCFSDFFDFPKLSTFADKRSPFEQVWDNDLGNAIEMHRRIMAIVKSAAPNAKYPAIPGNHDDRVFSNSRIQQAATSEYVLAQFLADVVEHGALWLGDEGLHNGIGLRLNKGLMMLHGVYVGKILETVMKSTLQMYLWQTNVLFGHVHRQGQRKWRGLDFDVTATSSPCLCLLQPHYTKTNSDWSQGIVVGEYDPNGRWHDSTIVSFSKDRGYLRARWGDREYSVRLPSSR